MVFREILKLRWARKFAHRLEGIGAICCSWNDLETLVDVISVVDIVDMVCLSLLDQNQLVPGMFLFLYSNNRDLVDVVCRFHPSFFLIISNRHRRHLPTTPCGYRTEPGRDRTTWCVVTIEPRPNRDTKWFDKRR
jgi:hypothetical protein